MIERLLNWLLQFILKNPLIFWTCVVANVLGTVVGGVWWYGPLLAAAPFWALPFIPDCPLGSLLGTVALFGMRAQRRWGFFYALTAFWCMKYGLWTQVFWLRFWADGGPIEPVGLLMFVTHIGLFCEGLLFVPHIAPLALPKRLAVIGWFALSIGVDYGLRNYALRAYGFPFHPPMPTEMVGFMFWTATLLVGLLGVGLLALRQPVLRQGTRHEAAGARQQMTGD